MFFRARESPGFVEHLVLPLVVTTTTSRGWVWVPPFHPLRVGTGDNVPEDLEHVVKFENSWRSPRQVRLTEFVSWRNRWNVTIASQGISLCEDNLVCQNGHHGTVLGNLLGPTGGPKRNQKVGKVPTPRRHPPRKGKESQMWKATTTSSCQATTPSL